ncbi:Single minded [Aphelenchoides avenae]|nr:Single minded [Aphelenchus avenae]
MLRGTKRKRAGSASSTGSRRDKEKQVAAELTSLLPLPPPIRDKLDKPSAIKIAHAVFLLQHILYQTKGVFSYLRVEQQVVDVLALDLRKRVSLSDFAMTSLQTMDGFVLILNDHGTVVYVSETAAVHFGFAQVDLIGLALHTIVHESDQSILQHITYSEHEKNCWGEEIAFTLRLQCAPGRRTTGSVIGGYKTIHFTGRLLSQAECRFIGYGEPIVSFAYNEHRLSSCTFMVRTTLALRMVFVESRIEALTGFTASIFLDRTLYEVIHAEDVDTIKTAHKSLVDSGQAQTGYYRLMRHGGGWNWMTTKFIRVAGNATSHLQLVIAINCMLR